MPQAYDVAIAWNWEYDADFVTLLDAACRARDLSLLQITPGTLAATLDRLQAGDSAFRLLLDRAWDVDEAFYPLADGCRARGVRILNDRPLALRAWDKATMHLEFISAGLHAPHTIVLPPFDEAPDPPAPDLAPLGHPLILKPAHGGGGAGVRRDLTGWAQIQDIRRENPADKYLVQARVTPGRTEAGQAPATTSASQSKAPSGHTDHTTRTTPCRAPSGSGSSRSPSGPSDRRRGPQPFPRSPTFSPGRTSRQSSPAGTGPMSHRGRRNWKSPTPSIT